MKTLYLIRGIPGSGKSTFAKELYRSSLVDAVFEADQYFTTIDGKYKFDPSKIEAAHSACQKNVIDALNAGKSVAVSNTSCAEWEVRVYEKIANETKSKFVSVIVENRHGNGSVHDVPSDVIENMRKRFSVNI